jgi:hypothetical protein
MNMENLINFDLKTYPDIAEMLEGVSPGDVVKINASFQVKELSEKRFTGTFEDSKGITINEDSDSDEEDEDSSDEGSEDSEESETEETSG